MRKINALVIYDSTYGNTEKIAQVIAKTLKSQIVKAENFKKELLEGLNLLVVGSPIQGWRPTQTTGILLDSLPKNSLEGINFAAFDTRIKVFYSGDAAGKIDKKLKKLNGKPIVSPEKFFVVGKEGPLVEGELDRAEIWANKIHQKVII